MSGEAELAVASAILNGGAIELAPGHDLSDRWTESAAGELHAALRQIDSAARGDAPGSGPPLELKAACWGLKQLTLLARCLVDRRLEPDQIERATESLHAADPPDPGDASHVWSVDLCLRYLKDLRPQIRGFVEADPVRQHYGRLIREWPLSCPSQDVTEPTTWAHPTLQRLALDRVESK